MAKLAVTKRYTNKAAQPMRCHVCRSEIDGRGRFCTECGSALNRICPSCHAENPAMARFCGQCATRLESAPEQAAPFHTHPTVTIDDDGSAPDPMLEGERKLVSVLFADIKGSVELMVELDAEEARAIVDPALRLMVDAVQTYEGYVVQTTGDGILALFGAPAAYQDHPRRAIHAGLAMQATLRAFSDGLVQQSKSPIEVRIGINTGEAVVRALNTGGRLEYNGIGHTVNLAARLQTTAPPGSIAVGSLTAKLTEGYFDLRVLPPMVLKGIREPVTAHEVTGVGLLRRHMEIALRRGLSKFVGRDGDMALLHAAFQQTLDGRGRIVATVTGPGTGKSRLLYEFLRTVPANCRVLEAYALSHGKGTPWLPVIDLLHGYFDLRPGDGPSDRRQKIACALTALDPELADRAPYLVGLFGLNEGNDPLVRMDATVRRARTIDAINQIFLAEARRAPLILIFEDLHWVDEPTRLLLDALATVIANARILLLATWRPEFAGLWRANPAYTELRLAPLAADCAAELLDSLLPDAKQLAPFKQFIIEKAAGNPFFIEEIVRSLFEDGTIARVGGILWLAKPLGQLRLPQTVQDTLAERIDKLPPSHKDVLQTLAVIGDRLPVELVGEVCVRTRHRLAEILSELHRADFIYGQAGQNSATFFFKHALTQEVAYGTLVSDRRRRLHERVAAAMEQLYAERLDDHVSQIAHHYSRTGDMPKAIHYLGRAGEIAVQRAAHAEAVENLKATLNLLASLPESPERAAQEARFCLALGVSLTTQLGYAASDVGAAYERAWRLSAELDDIAQVAAAVRGHSMFSIVRADYGTAVRLANQLFPLRSESRAYESERLMILGLASLYTGATQEAERHFLEAISATADDGRMGTIQYSGHTKAICLSYLAIGVSFLGYPERAVRYSNKGIALGQRVSIPITIAQTNGMYGILTLTQRRYAVAEKYWDWTIGYAAEHGFPYWQTLGKLLKGRLIAARDPDSTGIAQFDEYLGIYLASGARIGVPWFYSMRAEMFLARGDPEEGLRSIDDGFGMIRQTNECSHEAELHRLHGELLLLRDGGNGADAARDCFRLSLDVARRQAAKSFELRTAISLARLLQSERRPEAGVELLSQVLAWFTEGHATPDLQDARALQNAVTGAVTDQDSWQTPRIAVK
jgi:class 3 adenylate cyclase/tetratricopeptide (TPR) repeat protein